jgi:hypothetical protein
VGASDGDMGAHHHIADLTRVSVAVDEGGLIVWLA